MGAPAKPWQDANAYERFMGRWSRQLAQRLVEWAEVPLGARAIDVGCGTGALSAALLRAGASQVVGTDRSPDYVERATATAAKDPRARFRQGEATHLDEPDGAFDAALSCLVLNFVGDPLRMVREMARVTRPGGTVALCVWDYAGRMEMLRTFFDVATELDPEGAGPVDEGRTFPICNPVALDALFRDAGLVDVRTEPIEIPMVFPSFDDFWLPFTSGSGPSQRYVVGLAPDRREALRKALRERVVARSDGSIALVGGAWGVAGTRP